MKIEILVFDGCPNSEPTEGLVRETVAELEIDANIEVVKVVDNDDALSKRFIGSPSIRINGADLEIEGDDLTQYAMRCRIYREGDSQSGLPPKELLKKRLAEVT
jgi:hypothetical protein